MTVVERIGGRGDYQNVTYQTTPVFGIGQRMTKE